MTTFRTFTNQAEAALCVSVIRAGEIDAVLLDEGSFQGNYAGMAIPIRLQVPKEHAEEAVALLGGTTD